MVRKLCKSMGLLLVGFLNIQAYANGLDSQTDFPYTIRSDTFSKIENADELIIKRGDRGEIVFTKDKIQLCAIRRHADGTQRECTDMLNRGRPLYPAAVKVDQYGAVDIYTNTQFDLPWFRYSASCIMPSLTPVTVSGGRLKYVLGGYSCGPASEDLLRASDLVIEVDADLNARRIR